MSKQARTGKVFVDWSQNDEHKTTVAVYSLRAREHPTVSTPVTWEEVERAFKKKDAGLLVFEAPQVVARVEKMGDLFEPVLELKQRLPDLKKAGAAVPASEAIEIAAQAEEESRERGRARVNVAPKKSEEALTTEDTKFTNERRCRNSLQELRDGLIRRGSLISIRPSWRRRNFLATTRRSSTPSK